MPVTLDLPPDTQARLAAEAARRGISVDELVVQLAAALPQEISSGRAHRLGFVGIGASGRTAPEDIREERAELAARKLAEGA
ncbi:MAG: hypothetical protein AB7G23_20495 [Vicinamibacterales bacterium]